MSPGKETMTQTMGRVSERTERKKERERESHTLRKLTKQRTHHLEGKN